MKGRLSMWIRNKANGNKTADLVAKFFTDHWGKPDWPPTPNQEGGTTLGRQYVLETLRKYNPNLPENEDTVCIKLGIRGMLGELLQLASRFDKWASDNDYIYQQAASIAREASRDLQCLCGLAVEHTIKHLKTELGRTQNPDETEIQEAALYDNLRHLLLNNYRPGPLTKRHCLLGLAMDWEMSEFIACAPVQDFIENEWNPDVKLLGQPASYTRKMAIELTEDLGWTFAFGLGHQCLGCLIWVDQLYSCFKRTRNAAGATNPFELDQLSPIAMHRRKYWSPERKDFAWNLQYGIFLVLLCFVSGPHTVEPGERPPIVECVVGLWLVSLALHEAAEMGLACTMGNWRAYFSGPWNYIDLFGVLFGLAAAGLRTALIYSGDEDTNLYYGRILYHAVWTHAVAATLLV